MNPLAIVLMLAMLATAGVLFVGLAGFFQGGAFNERYGNRLMRARVGLQLLAVHAAGPAVPHPGLSSDAMVILSQIYTRGGDQGRTSLGDGTRVAKHAGPRRRLRHGGRGQRHDRAGAPAHGGRRRRDARADPERPVRPRRRSVPARQTISTMPKALRIRESQVERLEHEIDAMNAELQPLTSFVLPGGSAGRGLPASRPHRDATRRAADLRAGRGRDGQSRRDPLFEPTIGSSVRSVALAEQQGRRRRALGSRREPLIQGAGAN